MICPHCQINGIKPWSKYWSGSTSPAVCSSCGQPSYIPIKYIKLGDFIEWGATFASIYIAYITQSFIPLIAALLIFITIELSVLYYAPLRKTTNDKVIKNKKYGNIFLLMLLLVILLAVLLE